MVTYRVRWSLALARSLPLPLVLGAITVLVVRPAWVGAILAVLLTSTLAAPSLARVRGRTLTISGSGLQAQLDNYVLSVPWGSVTGIQRRKLLGVIQFDELSLAAGELEARGTGGNATPTPETIASDPAAQKIQISLYDKHWRAGPVGDHLRDAGFGGG